MYVVKEEDTGSIEMKARIAIHGSKCKWRHNLKNALLGPSNWNTYYCFRSNLYETSNP